jgi:hypothetical protein
MKSICYALLLTTLSGCSLMNSSGSKSSQREVRDQNQIVESQNSSGPRKRVAVLPFLDNNDHPEGFRLESQIRMIEEINRNGVMKAFLVLPVDLKNCSVLNFEYDFRSCSSEAQKLGYQALFEGRIIKLEVKRGEDPVGIVRKVRTVVEATLRLRVYNPRTQKEIFNTDKIVTTTFEDTKFGTRMTTDQLVNNNPQVLEKIIVDGFLEFLPQIEKKLVQVAWEGRIAAIQGQKFYLNVGNLSGVQLGDLLRVVEEGPSIYDPQMGTAIGQAPGRVKGTLEVVSYFGNDGAIAILHSGGGFLENDRVEIY